MEMQIGETLRELRESLELHYKGYDQRQLVHFNWLESVRLQLETRDEENRRSFGNTDSSNSGSPLHRVTFVEGRQSVSSTGPLKFVDDSSLLDDSSSDSEEVVVTQVRNRAISPIIARSYSEMARSASSFRAQWQNMICEQKSRSMAHEIRMELSHAILPCDYPMTDDEDLAPVASDDEMYDFDPIEIHGKTVPLWCHREELERILRKQQNADTDAIFEGVAKRCSLESVFQCPVWNSE
jgi:hypothetical protein